mmetsp:Transcript_14088/g.19552  ORF Transcript_14088/g.19552 Transcript_14088/m.19552 type:complete len:110 (-) Transcript_14088:202-531(-)
MRLDARKARHTAPLSGTPETKTPTGLKAMNTIKHVKKAASTMKIVVASFTSSLVSTGTRARGLMNSMPPAANFAMKKLDVKADKTAGDASVLPREITVLTLCSDRSVPN